MLWLRSSLGVTLIVLGLAACAPFAPYRTATLRYATEGGARQLMPAIERCESGTKPGRDGRAGCEDPSNATAARAALQQRFFSYRTGPGCPQGEADYHLAFVEFDDQGWFQDRKQMEALFRLLDGWREGDQHALILLYAHGWKHNASQCDNNVVCFSRFVERMAIMERFRHLWESKGERQPTCEELGEARRKGRRVVGVYVGWRGRSFRDGAFFDPLLNVTFWSRKSTAERVGRGGVMELLTRLDDYRWARNRTRDGDKTQLVITGHSFGGLVVHTAVSHLITERAAWVAPAERRYQTANSFGDFVVLVNPAFEGSLHEPLFHVATNRCYGQGQWPVLMIVTSSADNATGVAFPLGRKVSTVFERAHKDGQGDAILKTVGHQDRYRTHWLTPADPGAGGRMERERAEAAEKGAGEPPGCRCIHLEPSSTFEWWKYSQAFQGAASSEPMKHEEGEHGRRLYRRVYGPDVNLIGDAKFTPNYPYLVVETEKALVEDHNAIYNEPFIKFLHLFFIQHVAKKRPFVGACWPGPPACEGGRGIPCEQSCRLEGNVSCSGRLPLLDAPSTR